MRWLPRDAAVWRSIDPTTGWRTEHELLAEVIDRVSVVARLSAGLASLWGAESRDIERITDLGRSNRYPRPGWSTPTVEFAPSAPSIHDWAAALQTLFPGQGGDPS